MRAEGLEWELLEYFVTAHPNDVARVLETMGPEDAAAVVGALPPDHTADLFRYLPPLAAARSLARLEAEEAARHLATAREDVAAAILRAVQPDRRTAVLEALERERRAALERLLRYGEGTAGSLLDPRVLSIPEGLSVGQALERVRGEPEHALFYLYIVGEEHQLEGVVTLRELMLAAADEPVASIAERNVQSLRAEASWDAIVAHPGWRRVPTLPVVDARSRLLGVVRYESVRHLEHSLGADLDRDPTPRTAAAVGELYGLGARGLVLFGRALLGRDDGSSSGGRS